MAACPRTSTWTRGASCARRRPAGAARPSPTTCSSARTARAARSGSCSRRARARLCGCLAVIGTVKTCKSHSRNVASRCSSLRQVLGQGKGCWCMSVAIAQGCSGMLAILVGPGSMQARTQLCGRALLTPLSGSEKERHGHWRRPGTGALRAAGDGAAAGGHAVQDVPRLAAAGRARGRA